MNRASAWPLASSRPNRLAMKAPAIAPCVASAATESPPGQAPSSQTSAYATAPVTPNAAMRPASSARSGLTKVPAFPSAPMASAAPDAYANTRRTRGADVANAAAPAQSPAMAAQSATSANAGRIDVSTAWTELDTELCNDSQAEARAAHPSSSDTAVRRTARVGRSASENSASATNSHSGRQTGPRGASGARTSQMASATVYAAHTATRTPLNLGTPATHSPASSTATQSTSTSTPPS